MSTATAKVMQTSCQHCGQDIEGFAPYPKGEWRDRGNNWTCPTPEGDAGQVHEPYVEVMKVKRRADNIKQPANEPQPATAGECQHQRLLSWTEDGQRYQGCRDCGLRWQQSDGQPATVEGEGELCECGHPAADHVEVEANYAPCTADSEKCFCEDFSTAQPTTPHTATPWIVSHAGPNWAVMSADLKMGVANCGPSELSEANAALIVQRVNAFEGLVAVAQEVLESKWSAPGLKDNARAALKLAGK